MSDKKFPTEEEGEDWLNSQEGKEIISKIIQKFSTETLSRIA